MPFVFPAHPAWFQRKFCSVSTTALLRKLIRVSATCRGTGRREVLALSLDQEPGEVKEFLAHNRYSIPMAMRSDAFRQAFGDIRGTPTLFIVDRRGVVRFKHLGAIPPGDLGRIVEKLL